MNTVYTYGHDLISQERHDFSSNTWVAHHYGTDGLGNVRFLTDATGVITDTYDYDAFGNLIAQTGSTENHYRYTGEQYDPDLGMYFLRARYMDTSRGRFWNQDTFEGRNQDPQTLHKYLYTHGDPVNGIDPSGRATYIGTIIASGIRNLIQKAASVPHTRTAIAFGGAYGLGYYYGTKGPDYMIALITSAGVAGFVAADILVRGTMTNRFIIAETLNVTYATAIRVAQFLFRYVQPVTFMGSASLVGGALGYSTGLLYWYNVNEPERL